MPRKTAKTRAIGFTLSELLIALAILGVIATFTIPKVLQSQQDSRFKAIGKEVAGMVSEAYQRLKLEKGVDTSTGMHDLTPYFNYIQVDTVSTVDNDFANGTTSCSAASHICLRLHNGANMRIQIGGNDKFGGTETTRAIMFHLDPDGKVTTTGAAGTPGKEQDFYLYLNGAIRDCKNALPGSVAINGTNNDCPDPARQSDWFSWD